MYTLLGETSIVNCFHQTKLHFLQSRPPPISPALCFNVPVFSQLPYTQQNPHDQTQGSSVDENTG